MSVVYTFGVSKHFLANMTLQKRDIQVMAINKRQLKSNSNKESLIVQRSQDDEVQPCIRPPQVSWAL